MSRPTKVHLLRLTELQAKKRSLESEARAFATEIKQLQTVVADHLNSLGRDDARIHGYKCTLIEGRPSVKWKDEMVNVVGAEAVAEIVDNAPRGTTLTVAKV